MASWTGRRFWRLYAILAALRVFVAFTSTSVIHPDEHFQNPEISADVIFDYGTAAQDATTPLRTWEWLGTTPVRSVVPLLLSTGPAFWLLKGVAGAHPSARMLFFAERAVMLLLSFCIDLLIYAIAKQDRQALLLVATSPITFTFLLRPFSNSLETLCLALILYASSRTRRKCRDLVWFTACGAIAAVGCFVRVTFVAFAAPALLSAVLAGNSGDVARPFPRIVLRTALVAAGGVATASLCILADECFFLDGSSTTFLHRLPLITPINLLRYNLSPDNLTEHGLHPRYLHLLVNWPMLFGVGMVATFSATKHWLVGNAARGDPARSSDETALLLATVLVPTLALSVQPHQEPRFLVPLIVPVTALAASAPFLRDQSRKGRRRRRLFWGAWLSHSALFTLLFAYLHQGGLLPALFALNHGLSTPSTAVRRVGSLDLVFWRTFMPPRHLLLPLGPRESPEPVIRVTDLAGAPYTELAGSLAALSTSDASLAGGLESGQVILVAPDYASELSGLACSHSVTSHKSSGQPFCLEPLWSNRPSFGVHVDMDRLDQVIASKGRIGLGVWTVKSSFEGNR